MEDTMKKTIIIIVLSLLISTSTSVGLLAQTPKEIVSKCVNALGGEEAIKKHMDFSAEGEMKISIRMMELSGKLKMIKKQRKSWIKAEVTLGNNLFIMILAFDGKTAWMDRLNTIADQPALNFESDLDHTLSLLTEKNATFSLAKETEIEGKKVVGIDADFKGKKTTFFIDRETYLPLEIVFKDLYFGESTTKEMLEKRIRYLDIKKFSGVLFPSKMVFYEKGKKKMEVGFDKVVFNPNVSPDIFARPDQEPDLRYFEEMIH
jgi:hypothetical protein